MQGLSLFITGRTRVHKEWHEITAAYTWPTLQANKDVPHLQPCSSTRRHKNSTAWHLVRLCCQTGTEAGRNMTTLILSMRSSRMREASRPAGKLLPASPAEAASLVGGMAREGCCSVRGAKRGCCMCRPRDRCAGEQALAALGLAVALDHVPQRHQMQRMQHLIPPLPLALLSKILSSLAWTDNHCLPQAEHAVVGHSTPSHSRISSSYPIC